MTAWILQTNPNTFDIDAYLNTKPNVASWRVGDQGDDIRVGDWVYIWRAAGRRRSSSGIVAAATVRRAVHLATDQLEARPFWQDSSDTHAEAKRIELNMTGIARPGHLIARELLEQHNVLQHLGILRFAQRTVFRLSDAEADALVEPWIAVPRDWTRAEDIAALRTYLDVRSVPLSKAIGAPIAEVAREIKRSVNSAYVKMLNFRALDPSDPRGRPNVSSVDRAVWAEFRNDAIGAIERGRLDREYEQIWHPSDDQTFTIVTDQNEIRDAYRTWHRAMHADAERVREPKVFTHSGCWAEIKTDPEQETNTASWKMRADLGIDVSGSQRVITVNTGIIAPNYNAQGAVARDNQGRIWILRQGFLRHQKDGISDVTALRFAARTILPSVNVNGADGRKYYAVTCLDQAPYLIARDCFLFASECAAVRLLESDESTAVQMRRAVALRAARRITKVVGREPTNRRYTLPGTDVVEVESYHGDVCDALSGVLEAAGIPHDPLGSGGYKLDMAAFAEDTTVLFEVKTAADPYSVYTAVGQLIVYPELIAAFEEGIPITRVLVAPSDMASLLRECVERCGFAVYGFDVDAGRITLDDELVEFINALRPGRAPANISDEIDIG